jgi:hypothetical protein
MIKQAALLVIFVLCFSSSGCMSREQGIDNCMIVMQGLDQCAAARESGSSCDIAVGNLKQLLNKISINDYKHVMWTSDCKSICTGSIEYRAIVRRNFENICINSEVFSIKDDRFIKLAALTGLWLFSFAVFIAGVHSVVRVRRVRRDAIRTKGTVVDHEASRDGSKVYAPIIEFRDRMGRTHRFTSGVASSRMGRPSEVVDSIVKIIYPKDKPEEASRDSFMALWFVPFLLLVWGGGFVLITSLGLFSPDEWRKHRAYLQLHAPVLANASDALVHSFHEHVPALTATKDYRFVDEKPGSVVIEVEYRLSPFKEGDVYMGAITLTDGHGGGEWAYRPARLQEGTGTARVVLSMGSAAPNSYCSNQIRLSMYVSGGESFYERVIPYEKCWTKL